MEKANKLLKQRLVALRKAFGWSQKELAVKSKISLRHIQSIEGGGVDLRLTTVSKLAKVFSIEPFQFFCDEKIETLALHAKAAGSHAIDKNLGRLLYTPFCPLDGFASAIRIVDTAGLVWYLNAKACELHGYTRDEIALKMHVWDFLQTEKEKEDLKKFFSFVLKEEPLPNPEVFQNRKKNGDVVTLRADWQYIRDHKKKIIGFFCCFNSGYGLCG